MNVKSGLPISTGVHCTDKGKISKKAMMTYSAKECAYTAVFVAFVIALQLMFTAVPGVEFVTVCFVVYAYVFGYERGMAAATVFSILRQVLFGFFPTVLILYLFYYNALSLFFGYFGGRKNPMRLGGVIVCSCIATVCFSLLDCVFTPLWYGYSWLLAKQYFLASVPFMTSQVICVGISVGVLFYPLCKVFRVVKKSR